MAASPARTNDDPLPRNSRETISARNLMNAMPSPLTGTLTVRSGARVNSAPCSVDCDLCRQPARSSGVRTRTLKPLLFPLLFLLTVVPAWSDDAGLRIRFGLKDTEATTWDGTVSVSPGRVALIGGWRFAQNDAVDGTSGWKA